MYMIDWNKGDKFMGTSRVAFETESAAEWYVQNSQEGMDYNHWGYTPCIYYVGCYSLEDVKKLFAGRKNHG